MYIVAPFFHHSPPLTYSMYYCECISVVVQPHGNSTSHIRVNTIYISSLMHKNAPPICPLKQQQQQTKKNCFVIILCRCCFSFRIFFSPCIFFYFIFLIFRYFSLPPFDMVVVLCLLPF